MTLNPLKLPFELLGDFFGDYWFVLLALSVSLLTLYRVEYRIWKDRRNGK